MQQAQGWNKWKMVALNALEQVEKIQQLNSNPTVSSCSVPGSMLVLYMDQRMTKACPEDDTGLE